MIDLGGKVAFITGAASGIGLALARACAGQGMKVMMADLDAQGLYAQLQALLHAGMDVKAVQCDVTEVAAMRAAARTTIREFGKVHLLANNAGVFVEGGAGEVPLETWRWVVDVNFMSVVHGVETFLPLIRAHGEGGHILNTASMAGLVGFAGLAPYVATKHAVFGYSESLAGQLKSEGIGVSVLCPGFVNTKIADIGRYAASHVEQNNAEVEASVRQGMSPEVVAEYALQQIQSDALYLFTHPGTREEAMERYQHIASAYDSTAASELINRDPDAQRAASKASIEGMHKRTTSGGSLD